MRWKVQCVQKESEKSVSQNDVLKMKTCLRGKNETGHESLLTRPKQCMQRVWDGESSRESPLPEKLFRRRPLQKCSQRACSSVRDSHVCTRYACLWQATKTEMQAKTCTPENIPMPFKTQQQNKRERWGNGISYKKCYRSLTIWIERAYIMSLSLETNTMRVSAKIQYYNIMSVTTRYSPVWIYVVVMLSIFVYVKNFMHICLFLHLKIYILLFILEHFYLQKWKKQCHHVFMLYMVTYMLCL